MSGRHTTQLVESAGCAPGVRTYRFAKPAGYTFLAGQYMTLELETAEGKQAKPFTHAEAPADPYLEVTTRMTGSAFKRALDALAPGDEVVIEGPKGRRALPEGARKAAFLVGGVGITVARSVLRDTHPEGFDAVLLYGNNDPSCVPFAEELAELSCDGWLTVVHVFAQAPEEWRGERGFITAQLVRRHLDPAEGWHFVVTGPPAMVDAMGPVLEQLGVPPERTTIGRFTGYA